MGGGDQGSLDNGWWAMQTQGPGNGSWKMQGQKQTGEAAVPAPFLTVSGTLETLLDLLCVTFFITHASKLRGHVQSHGIGKNIFSKYYKTGN